MNFFEHQDQAKKKTKLLILLFVGAVLGVLVAVNLCVLGIIWFSEAQQLLSEPLGASRISYQIVFWVSLVTLGIIFGMSGVKWWQISSHGGESVAESLGGRIVDPATKDPAERMLMNVVEEMSIASGIAVPFVYILNEPGINAFAAGFSPNSAVIGVTKGSLETLTRDELQGVVAHEFSHIFNGDMLLNMRLLGALHGIFSISLLGHILLRGMGFSGGRRGAGRVGKGGGQIALLGLALIVIGSLGVALGRVIQGAVSRQREYLADASAVQFTRNPDGIAGALKKIGGWSEQGKIDDPHAQELSHFFLASPLYSSWTRATRTHPPLENRIRAIDPSFRVPKSEPKRAATGSSSKLTGQQPSSTAPAPATTSSPTSGANILGGGLPGMQNFPVLSQNEPLSQIGSISSLTLLAASNLMSRFSVQLKESTSHPESAKVVVYSLFLNPEPSALERQLDLLGSELTSLQNRDLRSHFAEISNLGSDVRLPLIDLCMPSLRSLSDPEKSRVIEVSGQLAKADQKLHLFEFALLKILSSQLIASTAQKEFKLKASEAMSLVLSALAHSGTDNLGESKKAFSDAQHLLLNGSKLFYHSPEDLNLRDLNRALDLLRQSPEKEKESFLQAAWACVCSNGKLKPTEKEMFRAVTESMDVPIPLMTNNSVPEKMTA
ncbi:MAG: hypothetical protein EA369_07110 [Bradymonadales bacterium]|nr:MAG: hypothetical protein EA369_07110 [Bradymonadales bacterium]